MKQATNNKNKRDAERIRMQEQMDFNTTVTIFQDIFSEYETTFTQMPEFSPSDMRMEVKGHQPHLYNVEIKTRNQDMNKYHTFLLKEAKYNRLIQDTKDGEKLLYIVLVNDSEYYIFDLDSIDISTIPKKEITIQAQEYNVGGSTYVTVPAYVFPIALAVNNGKIKK